MASPQTDEWIFYDFQVLVPLKHRRLMRTKRLILKRRLETQELCEEGGTPFEAEQLLGWGWLSTIMSHLLSVQQEEGEQATQKQRT